MLRFILIDSTMFEAGDDNMGTQKNIMWAIEFLVQRNAEYLKQRPNTRRLYRSGVKYMSPQQFLGDVNEVAVLKAALGKTADQPSVQRALETVQDVLGGERFRDIGRIIENGGGDCDNLAAWRAAELRQCGIKADPYMTNRKRMDGGVTYHALVLWPSLRDLVRDGLLTEESIRGRSDADFQTTEDPSLLLGMGGESRKADRAEEIRKNQERCDLLRAAKSSPAALRSAPAVDALMDDVLGVRRGNKAHGVDAAIAELDAMFRSAA